MVRLGGIDRDLVESRLPVVTILPYRHAPRIGPVVTNATIIREKTREKRTSNDQIPLFRGNNRPDRESPNALGNQSSAASNADNPINVR